MKVGTDGVLLGAWANPSGSNDPLTALDIGTGTGLLSLMLAQRFPKIQITALEIDSEAYLQAQANFTNSPWSARLTSIHGDFLQWQSPSGFDLIISNPPYHKEKQTSPEAQRNLARNAESLPLSRLLEKGSALLNPEGILSIILPLSTEEELKSSSSRCGLFPRRICYLRGHFQSPVKRYMVSLGKIPITAKVETMVIERSRHTLTEQCAALTRDFYPFLP